METPRTVSDGSRRCVRMRIAGGNHLPALRSAELLDSNHRACSNAANQFPVNTDIDAQSLDLIDRKSEVI